MERESPPAGAGRAVVEAAGAGAVLLPLVFCLASGLLHASLWMDEINYHYMEDDLALRAAELGRSGSALAPRLGIFFYCDVQKAFHAIVRPLGLTLTRDPELYLRLLSLLAFGFATLGLYAFVRRRSASTLDAVLVAGAFGSIPILLHYAFEARVYEFSTMLVVFVTIAVIGASRRPSAGRLLLVAVLSSLAAHSHAWTVCLFGPLLLVGIIDAARSRKVTPRAAAAAAAAIPALVIVGTQFLYMRATDPGAPLFPPFLPQPPGFTLLEIIASNFFGVLQTQYFVRLRLPLSILAWTGSGVLIGLLGLSVLRPRAGSEGREGRIWAAIVAAALAACWLLAVTVGYYRHASYHVPLLGALFIAVALVPSRIKRLLFGLLIALNVALLPATIRAIELKGTMREVAGHILASGTRDVAVVCQHVVTGGYPVPAQAIGLDFYLNVLHPGETPILIYEKPDLTLVNGRRGVYDLFTGGVPVLERYLASKPDLWRAKRDELRPHLFILEQAWNIEEGNRQNLDFARVMLEGGDRQVVSKLWVGGFPQTHLVELRRRDGR